ncbi:lytic murein transglycosylase [Roseospira marina]|uniref:Lytic murein transglycosylase n=1 Tax=Roseospira marina TaxID=140057 RepID=A0A5M6IG13_9PROT|nr:lytic murein transglycosylase [Roseospira marina]KAA5607246.1 lytic murein transglycosylase [Roseospira marina]MBB4312602.1 membrane-bound lytic murein transglycosylase B [Roseospira marina]MBB5085382.1 membrane-bound lytic murein transglycosylase B [Roseospira marina]
MSRFLVRRDFFRVALGVAVLGAVPTLTACAGSSASTAASPSGAPSAPPAAAEPFETWLAALRVEARGRGISNRTLDRALANIHPNRRVIELDRRQPEFTSTFWGYFDSAASDQRVADGRAMLEQHSSLLTAVARDTGVPAHVLVAFWGLETNYGRNMGGFNVIEALATLAWEGRRGAFFRQELLTALTIVEEGHIAPEAMDGSWAGAMGHMQFMPSTFVGYATDRNGDGRKDIWGSLPDAFGSAGRFLAAMGWHSDELWGRQVRLPAGFDYAQSDLDLRKSLAEWAALGLRRADGGALPVVAGMTASLLLPAGHEGPAFLVYDNFRVIMRWNNSSFYALAIGHLSDRIAGHGDLVGTFDHTPHPLRRTEVEAMQGLLNRLGYDAGPVDGLVGPSTRAAIRGFQAAQGLPADGYADPALYARLRRAAGMAN